MQVPHSPEQHCPGPHLGCCTVGLYPSLAATGPCALQALQLQGRLHLTGAQQNTTWNEWDNQETPDVHTTCPCLRPFRAHLQNTASPKCEQRCSNMPLPETLTLTLTGTADTCENAMRKALRCSPPPAGQTLHDNGLAGRPISCSPRSSSERPRGRRCRALCALGTAWPGGQRWAKAQMAGELDGWSAC